MKYYFITYQAKSRQGPVQIWNQVINQSPMEFIKHAQEADENGGNFYYNFVVINTCEISEDDFNTYDGHF